MITGFVASEIYLYPPNGGPLEASNTGGSYDHTLDQQLLQSGLYTIVISDNGLSSSGDYNIAFTKTPPDLRPGIYTPSPQNGQTVCNFNGSFSWSLTGAQATGYDLYFGEDVINPLVKIGNNLSFPTLPFPSMQGEKTYYWRVVAHTASVDIQGPYWWFATCADAPITYYCDKDNDTYINSLSDGTCTGSGCIPAGCQTTPGNDCNDNNSAIHPGATDLCDGVDNDCNAGTPDGSGEIWYGLTCDGPDSDLCKEGTYTCTNGAQSCSDNTGNNVEVCSNNVDDNCNGQIDEGCLTNADLIVYSLTTSSSSGAGKNITITCTIKNQGTGTAGPSTTKIYFSTDTTYSAGDTYLGSCPVSSLGAGASNTCSISVTIPSGICADSFYIIAVADADNSVAESYTTSSENNNTKNKSIGIGPDLKVSSLTVPTIAGAGLPITISDITSNSGGDTAGTSTTKFFLSTNTTYDVWDTPLGSRSVPSLAPGATSNGSTSVTIPSNTPTISTYYIIAVSDANGVVAEFNEANNNLYKPIKIGPDLIVSALTAPTSAVRGSTISVTDTTKNQGGGAAGASTTKFYLSTNSTWDAGDTLLTTIPPGGRQVPALAPGASNTGSLSVIIPSGVITGNYYIIAVSDADNVVIETIETNNSKSKSITIQ
jgi:uncharacterized membrane protein